MTEAVQVVERNDLRTSLNMELLRRWENYIDASQKTVETYSKAMRQFFSYLQDNGISQPQREDVMAFKESLLKTHKPTTVQTYLSSVKLFFKWTEQEGLYPNVSDHVKGVKLDTEHKRDYLTSKQVGKLLGSVDRTTLKGKRDYAILSVMVTTGLRTVSIISANIEDIRTVGDSTALFYVGKGHSEKATYVKLAEPVEEALRDYLKTRGETDGQEPLFASIAPRNKGERMTTRSISRVVKDHLIDVGLESDRLCAHSLRHTTATLNLLNGGTVEETQQLLDHSNINTTLIYSHALEREKNNSEIRVAQAIFG